MANPQINLVANDFDAFKSSLKDYLRSQTVFSDFDFEGSGMTQLLNVLAYNTFYNNWYLNTIGNEMFLDTAQLRASVVSHAKMLGYTPRSTRSASATVTVTITANDSPASVTIPQYTQFGAVLDGEQYSFYTLESTAITRDSADQTEYSANVAIVEGEKLQHRFTVDTSNDLQRFVLPNRNIDSTTLTVRVQTSNVNSSSAVFSLANGIAAIESTSNVYFLHETYDQRLELKFGDGVVGSALQSNNIVIVDYLISSGEEANKANSFSAPTSIDGYTTVTVELADTDAPASGGAPIETVESIKYLAPLVYEAQERCVTAQDYQAMIQQYVSGVESIAVWGGEDGDPRDEDNAPIYGKVFISIKPRGALFLSDLAKDQITRLILRDRMMLTMDPIIVDPDYVYLNIFSLVKYDSRATTDTADTIRDEIIETIEDYTDEYLGVYGSYFRYSRFVRAIDDTHTAITNSLTTVLLEKRVEPTLGTRNNYNVNFGNPLFESDGAIVSRNTFSHADENGIVQTACFLENDGEVMKIYRYTGTVKTTVQSNVGTINYDTGVIKLVRFAPTVITDGTRYVRLSAKPSSSDILPKQNQLIIIEDDMISVTMYDDTQTLPSTGTTGASVTGGGQSGGGGYVVDL